jgi:hypothetical protein
MMMTTFTTMSAEQHGIRRRLYRYGRVTRIAVQRDARWASTH